LTCFCSFNADSIEDNLRALELPAFTVSAHSASSDNFLLLRDEQYIDNSACWLAKTKNVNNDNLFEAFAAAPDADCAFKSVGSSSRKVVLHLDGFTSEELACAADLLAHRRLASDDRRLPRLIIHRLRPPRRKLRTRDLVPGFNIAGLALYSPSSFETARFAPCGVKQVLLNVGRY
jgi:hypothetical protein